MSDYTQEQLEGWNRLKLRRLAKKMKLDMDEVDAKKPSAIIKMILESQDGGDEEEPKPKKSKAGKKKLGKKARQAEPEPEVEEVEEVEEETGEVSGDMAELYNLLVDQAEKLDGFIEMYNKQQAAIMRDLETTHKMLELSLEMQLLEFKMLHEEEIIPGDGTKELAKLEKELGLGEE